MKRAYYFIIAGLVTSAFEFSLHCQSPNLLSGQPCPINKVTKPGTNGGIAGPTCSEVGGPIASSSRVYRSHS